jgi:hypothetical protein
MTSVPGTAFRTHLATLDRERATAFAAAVYAARGWAVDRDADADGADLLATPPDTDRPRRLVVRVDGEGAAPPNADRILDAAALHELVAYALPADERRRLCREFFDRDPVSFGPDEDDADGTVEAPEGGSAVVDGDAPTASTPGDGDDAGGTVEGSRRSVEPTSDERPVPTDEERAAHRSAATGETQSSDRSPAEPGEWLGRVAVVGLALSLVVVGVTAGGVDLGSPATAVLGDTGSELGAADDEPESTPPEFPRSVDAETRAGDGASTAAFPRGVGAAGVTNAAALADAHEATLSNRSYRLTITYLEFEDGELRGAAHEQAFVASRDRYRSSVRRFGTLEHDEMMVASGPMYANGSVGYIRTESGVEERPPVRAAFGSSASDVGFVDRTERTVQWYLSANATRIVELTERNGTATYHIAFEGDPWPESRNVTGQARVDETGMVRELHREYTPAMEPSVRIEVTIRIVPGPVTVTRPAWVAAADDERPPA